MSPLFLLPTALVIASILLLVARVIFPGRMIDRPAIPARRLAILALLGLALDGGGYGCFRLTRFSRHIRSGDPALNTRLVLLPCPSAGSRTSLVKTRVTIDDPATLVQVSGMLKEASWYLPSHPGVTWQVIIEVAAGDETTPVLVTRTENNGTLVTPYQAFGRIQLGLAGEYRNDDLGTLLEDLAKTHSR